MSRLRTRTKYNERSYKSNSEKSKKVYIIAVEGNETEVQYFKGIENNREYLGIPNVINIEILERDDTNSAPKHVVQLLEEYIEEGYTDQFIKNLKMYLDDANLGDSGENLIKKYFKNTLSPKVKEEVERILSEADVDRIYYQYMENWDIESKEFCVVFDRDAHSSKSWNFTQTVKDCLSKGYRVAFTNPCFEFWLLLHLCDAKEQCSLDNIKQNRPISKSRNYVEGELLKILGSYNKANIKFEEVFMRNIDNAIRREKEFTTDWKDLINNVGSNIGILIEEMRKG